MLRKKFFHSLRIFLSIVLIGLPVRGYCLPQGEVVVSGAATFDRVLPNTLTINQISDNLIANYNSFSIAQTEAVNFNQPTAQSIALNRVVGVDPSAILGTLTANGRVFLINPNGILFGQGCRVDTAGMVASTLDISDSDFLAGRYSFVDAGGSVVNQGYISSPGGYVALLGSSVENAGIIEANAGSVVLASGNAMTLEMDPQGFVSVALEQPTYANRSEAMDAALNIGLIRANGGKVVLTADVLNNLFDKAVNNEGIIEAQAYSDKSGEVLLLAYGDEQIAANTGTIDVSATVSGANGGFVEISGPQVNVAGIIEASSIDGASGALLIDPQNIIITEGGACDGLSGSTVGKLWLENCNFDVTIQALDSVIFDLYKSSQLDLKYFDTETFTILAGKNIELNNSSILTRGGDIKLVADYDHLPNVIGWINLGTGAGLKTSGGDVELIADMIRVSAPIKTSGGDVLIRSVTHDVTHTAQGDVETSGGNFIGISGQSYELRNDASISTGQGRLEITAQEDIRLGSEGEQVESTFSWKYLSDERGYHFTVFGYYYKDGNTTVFVPLVQGCDIGKDGVAPLSGSGLLPDDVTGVGLYTVFKTNDGSPFPTLTWYEDQHMNADKADHVKTCGTVYGWEDLYNLGDRDFDDAVIDFSITSRSYAPGAYLSSETSIDLAAGNSILLSAGKISLENQALPVPVIISSDPGVETWTNDNTVEISWVMSPQAQGAFNAVAGNAFVMTDGAVIDTNGGSATVTAKRDISLTLIDAGDGAVTLNSRFGSIRDNDLGIAGGTGTWPRQNDYDIIAGTIEMNAPNGSIGKNGTGEEIDVSYCSGSADYGFSFLWDESETTRPDLLLDIYQAARDDDGTWVYSATSPALADGIDWMFHLTAVRDNEQSAVVHYGKFFIDTTAPVITAGTATGTKGNLDWWLSDVTVPFSATDNLSGFSPDGALITDLASQTTAGEGTGLIVTSDGVYDQAGNFAAGITAGPFKVDQTAPVITAGTATGTKGNLDWWLSDVTVPFSATDNLSGFSPDGALSTDLASQTTAGEGTGLIVTSDGVYDQAGNFAAGITAGPFKVDQTAPVITAGTPSGTPGTGDTWASDVTVPFSATDNLSGFSPDGALSTDMASKTTVGEGAGLIVTSDGIYDIAGNFAAGINAGPFTVAYPLPINPDFADGAFLNNGMKYLRAYYEILSVYRFVSNEPATPTTFFAYHPITPMDMSGFDAIILDEEAYDFISDSLTLKKTHNYFGE